MQDFSGKVVLITGAAGNLGHAAVNAFAANGAKLALFDNRDDRLQKLYGEFAETSGHLLLGPVDVTDADSVEVAVEKVIERFGHIDMLINIAGGYRAGESIQETALDTWDFMINLNARSVFLVSRAVIPYMLSQGSGVIVNIGARPGVRGVAKAGAYSAAKSAVIRLTESLSAEVKRHGINVNCVMPGTIDTPSNRAAMPEAKHDRWVKPEAVVDVIQFLASNAARAIHGAAIPVYGTG